MTLLKCSAKPLAALISFSVALVALLFIPSIANAQSLDSKGTEFWLAFPDNADFLVPELSFFVSSEEPATVSVAIPGLPDADGVIDQTYLEEYVIDAGVALKIDLPQEAETVLADTVSDTGILVTSDAEITVYGLSRFPESTDAYLGLPTDVLGTDYIVVGYGDSISSTLGSTYLIAATTDETLISIVASPLDLDATDVEIMLNAGQVYQHFSASSDDVTGTIITSSSPVAVFAGHQCANIPSPSFFACDHIVEQLPSTASWGEQFLVAPLANRTGGDTFRILASADGTEVVINDGAAELIDTGEFFQTNLTEAANIVSSEPVLVVQYSNSTTFDDVTSDPFMMIVPPFEQFLEGYTFATPTEGFGANFANVVVRDSSATLLQLDGEFLDDSDFTPIPGSDFSYAQLPIDLGSHTLEGAVSGLFVYGFDDFDSYGYPGGLSLSEVALVDDVTLLDEYELVDGDACFTAIVTDELGEALADIRVDFTVDEDLLELSERTDLSGEAVICIEAGSNPGEYIVTATVGDLTVEGTVVEQASGSGGNGGGGGGCTVGSSEHLDPTLPVMALFGLLWIFRREKLEGVNRRG